MKYLCFLLSAFLVLLALAFGGVISAVFLVIYLFT